MKTLARLLPFATLLLVLSAGCGGETTDGEETTGYEVEPQEDTDARQEPGTEATGDTVLSDQQMLAQGEAIFTGRGICYTCHGQDGTGTQLAPDLTDDEWLNIPEPVTQEKIAVLVKSGVADPVEHPAPMPPMGGAQLSDEELQAVSAYVYQLSQ